MPFTYFKQLSRMILASLYILIAIPTSFARTEQIVNLGWQVPWATQGQLVMGLKYTNIPKLANVELVYTGFTYGGPLNRAALSGEVDVLLTADQPALVLLSKTDKFRIVARMMYNRVCLYVPPESEIKDLASLKGKRLMGPVGAAAERVAMRAIRDAGVTLNDLKAGSLDMAQQAALIRTARTRKAWRGVDALYGFDPLPAIFESNDQARMLHCGKVVSMVLASKQLLDERLFELQHFLRAFALSWAYFAQESHLLNKLFAKESKLDVDDKVLDLAAAIEPNRWVTEPSKIRLTFTREDLQLIDEALEFLVSKGIVKQTYDFKKFIVLGPLRDALSEYDLSAELRKVVPAQL
jgi:ABC-type nitrate/sulfonate/bicarbonate transport system substrate-binding protein